MSARGIAGATEDVRWIGVIDALALQRAACRRILHVARLAIEKRGKFLVVLAGGATSREVYRMLGDAHGDWPRWHVYFGDERCLDSEHPARNSRMATTAWIERVAIPLTQVHCIPAERGPQAAAQAYATTLQGIGVFDLVLLGLGADGHVAGLFPGHDWGTHRASADTLAVCNAPLPPGERVSLSAARLSRTREALYMVSGEVKRNAVARWRAGEHLPARAIRVAGGVDVLTESALLERGTA